MSAGDLLVAIAGRLGVSSGLRCPLQVIGQHLCLVVVVDCILVVDYWLLDFLR